MSALPNPLSPYEHYEQTALDNSPSGVVPM